MLLLVEVAMMLLVSNVLGQKQIAHSNYVQSIYGKHAVRAIAKNNKAPLESYKDVFMPGHGGKPTLGTMSSTCWARGGICIEIRECPSLKIDVSVAGCSYGHKVCCKVHESLSPTVGRRARIPTIKRPEDLGSVLQVIAYRNSLLLSNMDNELAFQDDRDEGADLNADST